ncbi:MAG: undecaprenyl/decaprenyl-phosphate alpha-N-acetylglucosaminyl 1-phosphate transferase [Bacteroidia bacterium]|nr:undecaprenyl/decaprenyl-phosphate alpha-N-acetylglucosaminyl 1-phosphate transferase [Bacteroidia bacterium]NNC84778.1 undecaprenyl/decaprenyl-phosphate alpha-N-acetylglucosaminyl 1-phosphate transferase [Bacteroidia bacterium]NNM15091.1 undecaprenyl/decaprenyl-phosphate alpha-N-acetylglucosaminyl 1-phosphate transferase [Bacteroidia bacterium]
MINITFCTITAFIITYLAIPSIIRVATIKHLYDVPDERKRHSSSVPTLGGLAIFAGVVFSYTFWSAGFSIESTQYIVAAIIVMFFIGIKDDIVDLSASKKFAGQLVSASIIVLFADIRITSLFGVFGIYEVNYLFSISLSMFTILVIINAFNLIDGIDGLAAGLGAIAAFTFGLWFYNYEQIGLCILSFSLFSSLLAFLIFNFSPATIFMGDTGSLIIGIILSVLAINFVELSFASPPYEFNFRSSPAMAIAILMVPLFDMFRIFIQRVLNGRSPFSADRNHMHHVLQDLGLTHREVAITLYLVSIGFIILALALRHISSLTLLIVESIVVIALSTIPYIIRYFLGRFQNAKKISA